MKNNMTPNEIREIILATQNEDGGKGRLFTITFRKKDGTLREMRARLGMKRNLTGKGQSYDPSKFNLITAWEADNGYRNIPLDRVVSLFVPDNSKHLRLAVNNG
jgi:hypothetical protein